LKDDFSPDLLGVCADKLVVVSSPDIKNTNKP